MVEVLIAMTNVVSQHAANQALLVSLARPLTEALAAWLSTFPLTLQTTDTPEASVTHVPLSASTAAQSDSAAMKQIRTAEESVGTALHTAPHEPSLMASKPASSALTARLKGQKQPSLLTAKLKGSMPSATKAASQDPSGSANPSGPAQDTASTQGAESGKKSTSQRPKDGEVQLAQRFIYHLLLHLPVEALQGRQDFWMEHAVGLPELVQTCIGVAVLRGPTVSHCHILKLRVAVVQALTVSHYNIVKHLIMFCLSCGMVSCISIKRSSHRWQVQGHQHLQTYFCTSKAGVADFGFADWPWPSFAFLIKCLC